MPRTRTKTKEVSEEPGSRSTAAIFLEKEDVVEVEEETGPGPLLSEEELAAAAAAASGVRPPRDDDPSTYSFPFNVIYTAQDFLNDHMYVRAWVQLLIVAFTSNLIYINHHDLVMEHYQLIGFNLLGVALGIVLTSYTMYKKHLENPEKIKAPKIPEFNLIHAIFIPTALTFFLTPEDLLQNLSLNYFVVDTLPIYARAALSFMFYYIYTDDAVISSAVLQKIGTYVALNIILRKINHGDEQTAADIPKVLEDEEDGEELDKIKEAAPEGTKKIGGGFSLQKSEVHLLTVLGVKILMTTFPLSPVSSLSTTAVPQEDNVYLPMLILQGLLYAVLISGAVTWPLLKYSQNLDLVGDPSFISDPKYVRSVLVFLFSFAFYRNSNRRLKPVFGEKPLEWLYKYITLSPERLHLVTLWSGILLASIVVVFISSFKLSLNSRRKIWHTVILLILLISQPLIKQPIFTLVSLCGAFIVLVLVELLRYNRLTFIGEALYDQLIVFQDSKDLIGPLNCSYIFLLLGITIPIALDFYEHGEITIYSYLGLINLGIGDSTASIIGKSFGTLKWTGSYKSFQGTFAFFVITLLSYFALENYLDVEVKDWESVFITCLIGSLLEGASDMNDNFLIPCFTYVASKALERKV